MSTVAEYRELVQKYLPRPIRNDIDYRRALRQLEKLMVPQPDPARSMLIEVLSTLIEQYEGREYPTADRTAAEMLAHCIESRQVTPAQVAKDTGIPQATLSNVLAGRRGISKAIALKLGRCFHVPAAVFLE